MKDNLIQKNGQYIETLLSLLIKNQLRKCLQENYRHFRAFVVE